MAFRIVEPCVESYSMPTAPSSSVKAGLATKDAQKVCSCAGRGELGENRERGADVRAEALVIPHLLLLLCGLLMPSCAMTATGME